MKQHPITGILHYSLPPVAGGVEAVILAQARNLSRKNIPLVLIGGRGERAALPSQAEFVQIDLLDTQIPAILELNEQLEKGELPENFKRVTERLMKDLKPVVQKTDHLIVHNVFTKHFNLPLTVALHRLLDEGTIRHLIAWCHDITWTSPNSRHKVHPGYPWDLLRTYRNDVDYIAVSGRRKADLVELFEVPGDSIQVIYNGVDPDKLLGLSPEGAALIERLELLASDLVILMPVRVTQAKNIEYALNLMAALKVRLEHPRLILTGPPDPHEPHSLAYYESLRTMRKQLDVEDNLRFVYESGPDHEEPYLVDELVVGDLFRVCDLIFMPSHREGFGMPVLEAGLAGVPVISTPIPAAQEIGRDSLMMIDHDLQPEELAGRLVEMLDRNPISRLRRQVRMEYTWDAIIRRQLMPLLSENGRNS
jgi:glycosyltransferase involved in cell wall biosynthesis